MAWELALAVTLKVAFLPQRAVQASVGYGARTPRCQLPPRAPDSATSTGLAGARADIESGWRNENIELVCSYSRQECTEKRTVSSRSIWQRLRRALDSGVPPGEGQGRRGATQGWRGGDEGAAQGGVRGGARGAESGARDAREGRVEGAGRGAERGAGAAAGPRLLLFMASWYRRVDCIGGGAAKKGTLLRGGAAVSTRLPTAPPYITHSAALSATLLHQPHCEEKMALRHAQALMAAAAALVLALASDMNVIRTVLHKQRRFTLCHGTEMQTSVNFELLIDEFNAQSATMVEDVKKKFFGYK
ncbi:Protein of unknown function [Gryllus bimaculatus]|nr:Protein of unknown function [Gryllus bimaculatus]